MVIVEKLYKSDEKNTFARMLDWAILNLLLFILFTLLHLMVPPPNLKFVCRHECVFFRKLERI